MCGIAGIWRRDGGAVPAADLERLCAALRHRGPDGRGHHVDGDLGLAHTRLTIIDLSARAAQPMASADGRFWITFNGEIHNYVELRAELIGAGRSFRTESDTEVVLEAFAHWGTGAFERFNGMWALAIWEPAAQQLILCRDRFGIKPLFYTQQGRRLAFASEIKALLAIQPELAAADDGEIYNFLAGGSPDTGRTTFFRDIRALEPGRFLRLRRTGDSDLQSYWAFQPGETVDPPDAPQQFAALFTDAVRLRLRSDVPLGAFLSGGLDSTAVARTAAQLLNRPLHCYSLRFPGSDLDESAFAQIGAADLPIQQHWVEPRPADLLEIIGKIVAHHDAPMPYRGRIGEWHLYGQVGEGIRVVLEGHGADEMVAGYDRFAVPYLLDVWQRRSPHAAARQARQLLPLIGRRPARWLALALAPALRSRGREPLRARRAMTAAFAQAHAPADARRCFNAWGMPGTQRPFDSHLNNALWQEFRTVGLPESLHATDALSMAFSLESRLPFLDHRLVEFVFRLPFDRKIRDGWTKHLVRDGLADRLPEPIRRRRSKLGLMSPVQRWLREPRTLAAARAVLLDPAVARHGVLRADFCERLLRDLERARTPERFAGTEILWRCLTFAIWTQRYFG